MAQQVVTELVIDANTSGADQFSQSMDKASASAEKGVGSVAGLTLSVAGAGIAFIGALTAMRGFIDYVGSVNKELVDMAANAEKAGMSTKSFQETLFAAKASGLTDKDFISGLDKIGADLQAASRGATDFGKLFEINRISIKQVNGDLKTTEQAIGDISNLIKNAPTLQMATAIASIVGLSKDWVPFLRQGVDGIEAQKQAAADLGVTLDDATIGKAKEFNAQWHTAIAIWDTQFKASLISILPLLTQLATLAVQIINGISSLTSGVQRLFTPDESMSKSQLSDQLDTIYKLREMVEKPVADQAFTVSALERLVGLPPGSSVAQIDALLDKLAGLYDKAPTRLTVTPSGNGSTVLPPTGGDANDAVDRAINTLRRHTEQQIADTRAVGLGDAALAGFRASAAETAAVQANHGNETDAQAASFLKVREAAIAAADALAKAKVASSISVSQQTTFLSAGDVAIANQLKGIYGNDIPAALNSTYAAAIRVNNAFKEVSAAIDTNLTSGLTDIVSGTKSVSKGFGDMGLAIVKALDQAIIKLLIVGPLMRALQGGAETAFPNLFGATASLGETSAVAGASSGMMGGVSFPMFASGTDSAPGGWSIIGEKGPELVNLSPGARVIPNGGSSSGAGNNTQVNVNVMNFGNDNVSVNQKQNGAGGIDLEVMVGQAAASQMAKKGSALRQVTDQRARVASR